MRQLKNSTVKEYFQLLFLSIAFIILSNFLLVKYENENFLVETEEIKSEIETDSEEGLDELEKQCFKDIGSSFSWSKGFLEANHSVPVTAIRRRSKLGSKIPLYILYSSIKTPFC